MKKTGYKCSVCKKIYKRSHSITKIKGIDYCFNCLPNKVPGYVIIK